MSELSLFLIQILLSFFMSLITLLILVKPLFYVLEDLCPTKKQVNFWMAYTKIMLLIAPLVLVLIVGLSNHTYRNNIDEIKFAFASALVGIMIGLIIVGQKILIPAQKSCDLKK